MDFICGIVDYWGEEICRTQKYKTREHQDKKECMLGRERGMKIVLGGKGNYNCSEVVYGGIKYISVFDGEIYNDIKLRESIISKMGFSPFKDESHAELIIWLYILKGGECPALIDGIFSFAVYTEACSPGEYVPKMFVARDKLGIKRLFYTYTQMGMVFSSELLGLSLYDPSIRFEIDKYGLYRLFFLADTYLNHSMFYGINEIGAGCCAYLDCRRGGGRSFIERKYWDVGEKLPPDTQKYGEYMQSIFKKSYLHRDELNSDVIKSEDVPDDVVFTRDYIDSLWVESPFEDIRFDFFVECMKARPAEKKLAVRNTLPELSEHFVLYRPYLPWVRDPYLLSEFTYADAFDQSDGFNYVLEIYSAFKSSCAISEEDCPKAKNHKLNTYLYFKSLYPSKYRTILKIANYFNMYVRDVLTDSDICSGIFNMPMGMNSETFFVPPSGNKTSRIIVPPQVKNELYERILSCNNGLFDLIDKNKLIEAAICDTDSNQLDMSFKILLWFYKTYLYLENLGADFCL